MLSAGRLGTQRPRARPPAKPWRRRSPSVGARVGGVSPGACARVTSQVDLDAVLRRRYTAQRVCLRCALARNTSLIIFAFVRKLASPYPILAMTRRIKYPIRGAASWLEFAFGKISQGHGYEVCVKRQVAFFRACVDLATKEALARCKF